VRQGWTGIAEPVQPEVDLNLLLPTFINFLAELDTSGSASIRLGLVPFTREDCSFTYHRYTIHAALRGQSSGSVPSDAKSEVARVAQRIYESISFKSGRYSFGFRAEE